VITVDPAQCAKKTVYQVQSIPVAAGDRLRWTKNDRAIGIRNGQTFVVQQMASDGTAQICDQEGNTRPIDLNRYPFLDYAWVSTIYSSQGKTGDRVMALLDGMTTHQESFYVTVSRAKHHLTLYTADLAELMQLAQKSHAKANVSDYIPLFKVNPYAQTQTAQTNDCSTTAAHRDLGQCIGDRVGERICQQLAADFSRTHRLEATGEPPGAENAAVTPDLDPPIATLSPAIADYLEQREFLDNAGDVAAAVAAIDCGLECLEQSTQSRTQLAAAVDRLDAAIGRQARRVESSEQSHSNHFQQRPAELMQIEAKVLTLANQQQYQQYSQGVQANPVKLDYLIELI
jgi:hypothetical protein